MSSLEIWSGVGLFAVAIVVLSPFWLPPLRKAISHRYWTVRIFMNSVPERREMAKAHWRGVAYQRFWSVVLLLLGALGGGWVYWVARDGIPQSDPPSAFQLLFFGIALGAMGCGIGALYFGGEAIAWAWEGFVKDDTPEPQQTNPMNRVGGAAPLGEARFATGQEVHGALSGHGDGDFVPPKFRD